MAISKVIPSYQGDKPDITTQQQAEFSTNADNVVGYITDLSDDLNALTPQINSTATEVQNNANTATTQANNSAASAAIASQAALAAKTSLNLDAFKGEWSAGTYAQGDSVYHKSAFWISNINSNTSEPSVANWSLLNTSTTTQNTVSFEVAREIRKQQYDRSGFDYSQEHGTVVEV